MMKFSALNESSLSDDNGDPELATREAQEEEAYTLYHLALKKQSEGKIEESENMLKQILEMEFLSQAFPNDEDDEEEEVEAPIRPALTLKYLLYKNLANISNNKKDFQSAVAYFLDALEIDNTDVMMWYQMGKASINIANYSLARLCFEEGLKCNPNHWPCLDNVITVMYTLNDYANCLYYIAQALERECYYLKGLAFKDEIYREDPSLKSFCESYFNKCDSSIHYAEYDKEEAKQLIQESLDMRVKKQSFYKPTPLPVLTLNQPIKEKTWKTLGDSLVNMYECIKMANPSISYSCKIDLSPYMDTVNKDGDKLPTPSPVSSLSEACSSNSVGPQKPEGLLQLATLPPDYQSRRSLVIEVTPVVDMEVDEQPVYNLVLTPVEVQPTDLSDSTSSNKRTSKRKRLLSELTDTKRRSSRVRNPAVKKPQDNINYQELLQKFLPSKLIGNGKCDYPDDDSEPVSLDKASADLSCGQSSENDKSEKTTSDSGDLTWSEKEDVTQFIAESQNNSGIIDLLYKYVVILGKKSTSIWPKNLIDVFCEAFTRLRNHITTPNLFCQSSDPDRIKEVSLAILCYCEFKVDKWYLSTGHSMSFSPKSSSGTTAFQNVHSSIGNDFHSDMEFLVMLTVRKDVLEKDWLDFSARALWLKAKFHSLEGEIDLAVCCMGKLSDILVDENDIKITVQNCGFSNVIGSEKVQQQLESLQRCQSLEEVQRLYEHCDYAAVVDLLVLTFNQPRTKRKQSLEGVPERHAQLLLLQNSLWKLERYKECVYWSEVSFNEALQQFMNAARSDWSETMAQLLNGLNNCVKLDSKYLSELEESKLVRLTQNLILVIVIQMENYDFSGDNASLLIVLPWMLLYRLILNEEKRSSSSKKPLKTPAIETGSAGNSSNKMGAVSFLTDFDLSSSMPSSLMLLFTAHEYLGRRSWCTFADGLLLLHNIDVMMTELKDTTGNSYLYREDLETGLEQCIYCLYGHPNKRSRAKHLQEHNSKQLTLTWEKAILIFQYFKPNVLPEFDSYRTSTVSAELESLLKRIIALVPPDEDPTTRVDSYTAYIEGVSEKCPDPPFKDKTLSPMVKDLYYLLGDYYFKNKEFSKAIRFYLMDICINPDRQDSWAGMALSRSSQLDQKLNSFELRNESTLYKKCASAPKNYELRNESTIYRKSSAALKCFEHALELDPTTTSLWIEHGSLAYILHSHASRQLKQDSVCDDLYELLRKKKLEMLQVAERCFRSANHCEDGGDPEEAWLHHYMLGKICEKKGEGPIVYLDHYQKALMYLHDDFARYPQKIQYHNPADLSIEALEVYYRVHASCLKFLWKHEDKGIDLATLKIIKQCLSAVAMSPFANFQEKCKKDEEEVSCSSTLHSEVEEIVTPALPAQPATNPDHNYFDAPQKISDDRRLSRPSIDSSPETQDSGAVKEVMDSLVGVVTERFVDEENEAEKKAKNSSKAFKIPIESVGEQSVYTTKKSPEIAPTAETVEETKENIEERAVKSIVLECEKMANLSPPDVVMEEPEPILPLQDRAMELESAAAASLLVEEMRLDTGYCEFEPYCEVPKQEDQDSAYYDYVESGDAQNVVGDEEAGKLVAEEETGKLVAEEETGKLVAEEEIGKSVAEEEVGKSIVEEEVWKSVVDEPIGKSVEDGLDQGAIAMEEDGEVVVETEIASVVSGVLDKLDEQEISSTVKSLDSKNTAEDVEMEEKVDCSMEVDGEEKHGDTSAAKETVIVPAKDISEGSILATSEAKESGKVSVSTVVEECRKGSTGGEIIADSDKKSSKGTSEDEINRSEMKKPVPSSEEFEEQSKNKSADIKESQAIANGRTEKQKSGGKSGKEAAVVKPPTPKELKQSQVEIAALVPLCMDSMREVLQRFIQHYKSLYRMAHYYCHSTRNKNLQWAREILLAATPPTKKYPAMPGLFADRKNTNFFNGIWRAPSNEIDRPGSFGAHMYRSVGLLIEVLTQQKDYNMLVNLTQQLYRTPDLGKKYMRDTDRVFLVRSSYDSCVRILRGQLDSLLGEEPPPEESRLTCCLLEIYRACQQLLRAGIYTEETNELLEEAYTMYRIGEVDDHPSVLEQATKFCQLQLGKSYPQNVHEPSKSSSKYLGVSDVTESNASLPPAYAADAWQKEYAKSLVMPVLPCKTTRVKPEVTQDPVILIPIDSSKFSGSTAATKTVHVEKPKAENLQACSLAYLPVFPKEGAAIPTTSLVSCQAFECFSVLQSIMQASGYKVAPQQLQDDPVNLVKPKLEVQNFPGTSRSTAGGLDVQNFPGTSKAGFLTSRPGVGRPPKRRRRRAAAQKMVALDLCKRIPVKHVASMGSCISTKPIVSSSIANSITELKVGNIISCHKKTVSEANKTSPSVLGQAVKGTPIVVDSVISDGAYKDSASQSRIEPTGLSETAAANTKDSVWKKSLLNDSTLKESFPSSSMIVADVDEDSSTSTNIDASVIEQCAKEMLEFINQRVEDMVLNSKPPIDFSNLKVRVRESFALSSTNKSKVQKEQSDNSKDSGMPKNVPSSIVISVDEKVSNVDETNFQNKKDVISTNPENENVKHESKTVGDNLGDAEKNSTTENSGTKVIAISKNIDDNNEENSDTLDADIKEDSLYVETKENINTFSGLLKDNDAPKLPVLESCELSKDSLTEFAIASPKPPNLEKEKDSTEL